MPKPARSQADPKPKPSQAQKKKPAAGARKGGASWWKWLLLILFLTLGAAFWAAWQVASYGDALIATDPRGVPDTPVALVLGTKPGNTYFNDRIEAAVRLFKSGRVKHFLVSGDNTTEDYDEPSAMRDALVAKGVPAGSITCDFAGRRTLDSVARAKQVFGQKEVVIVTQDWHLHRALYLAEHFGLKATGFAAPEHADSTSQMRVGAREWVGRLRAWLDVNVLNSQPVFPGSKPEPIPLPPALPRATGPEAVRFK